jgi:hypothetical protein
MEPVDAWVAPTVEPDEPELFSWYAYTTLTRLHPRRIVTWPQGSSYVRVMAANDNHPPGEPTDLAKLAEDAIPYVLAITVVAVLLFAFFG